ncbi:MAG: arginine N-succinyltransferase [Gammaproteobacteria bacterium]|nr:MAG: arginine N-succinyltransferase [Gammaproteobacteria bacterium]
MVVVRPAQLDDVETMYQLALEAGHGLTTLPANRERLTQKVLHSQASFDKSVQAAGDEYYLFVLENDDGEVIGTSALEAAVGLKQPFYTYKVGTIVHSSHTLGVHNQVETLFLGNDYTGATELCTLFLSPRYRKGHNGRLLSKARFLFLAQFPERFANLVIAEMRGYSDEQGRSPFWEALGRHFFSMSFAEADRLSGLGSNQFIAELMPKHPIYTCLLPEEARQVIGQVHPHTRPALKLLQSDGFRYRKYVDIFDAGPTIECETDKITTVRESRTGVVTEIENQNSELGVMHLISNTRLAGFRAVVAPLLGTQEEGYIISERVAERLNINKGDTIRVAPYRR